MHEWARGFIASRQRNSARSGQNDSGRVASFQYPRGMAEYHASEGVLQGVAPARTGVPDRPNAEVLR